MCIYICIYMFLYENREEMQYTSISLFPICISFKELCVGGAEGKVRVESTALELGECTAGY